MKEKYLKDSSGFYHRGLVIVGSESGNLYLWDLTYLMNVSRAPYISEEQVPKPRRTFTLNRNDQEVIQNFRQIDKVKMPYYQ